jgi:hypothetical protein
MKKTFTHKDFTAEFTNKNGYFALTGDIAGVTGAVGNKIADIEPRLKLVDALHLSDCRTGEPMHAKANALYFAKEILKSESKYTLNTLTNHLRITEDKAKELVGFVDKLSIYRHEAKNVSGYDTKIAETEKQIDAFFEELKKQWAEEAKEVYKIVEELPEDLTNYEELEEFDPEEVECPEKIRALADHLGINPALVEELSDNRFEAQGSEYLVVNDYEADELWEEDIENFIDDCILPELPEQYQSYFDYEKFKRDAKMDGRGHSLAKYDGMERENRDPETNELYFIYKN